MPQALARHVTEIGRIRIGTRVAIKSGTHMGQPRPERLKHFRLTSNSKAALELVAKHYGGAVQAWTVPAEWRESGAVATHTWEVFTTSEVLDVVFHPEGVMQTSWEEWQGGVCVLRCNGQYITKDGKGTRKGDPCRCPEDPQERKRLAAKKPPEACEEISRIALFLEGVPALMWRLDTKGFYAPAEVRGLQDIMRACEVADMLVRAQMRLEWRTDKKMEEGEIATFVYPVVVIEPRQSTDELLAIGEERRARQLHPATERKQLTEHITDLSEPVNPTAHQGGMRPTGGVTISGAVTPGELLPPAGEAGAEYIPLIENAVAALPNPRPDKLEEWWKWAERRFKTDRVHFTIEHYQEFLAKVREASQKMPTGTAQKPQEATQASQKVSEDAPPAERCVGDPGSPQLFPQDKQAEEYGNS